MREPAKATGKRQLVWSGPRPPGPPVWSLPRDTHICNSTYKHSTHSCMAQHRAPEVHWAQCQLCAYIIPDVLCNYAQTHVGLVQPRSNLLFAAVPPRLLKELCDWLQFFDALWFEQKLGDARWVQCRLFYFIYLNIHLLHRLFPLDFSSPLCCEEWVNAKRVWEDGKRHPVTELTEGWGKDNNSFCLARPCRRKKTSFLCSAGVQHVHRQGGRQGHAIRRPSAGRPCNKQAQPPGAGASLGQGHQVCIGWSSSGAGLHGLRPWDLSGWATLYSLTFIFTMMHMKMPFKCFFFLSFFKAIGSVYFKLVLSGDSNFKSN